MQLGSIFGEALSASLNPTSSSRYNGDFLFRTHIIQAQTKTTTMTKSGLFSPILLHRSLIHNTPVFSNTDPIKRGW